MPTFHVLTARDCAIIAEQLRKAVDRFGIRVSPSSDLDVMIREVGWLGQGDPDSIQPDTSWAIDKDRTASAFLLTEQARRIARTLLYVADCEGVSAKTAILKNRLNRLVSLSEQSQDTLFELEMAGRLVQSGISVEFGEPDLVLSVIGSMTQFAVACKRPRTLRGLLQCLEGGGRQLRDSGNAGIILIGAEALMHSQTSGLRTFHGLSFDRLYYEGNRLIDEVVASATRRMATIFDRYPVIGIHFSGIVTGVTTEPSAYSYAWVHRSVPRDVEVGGFMTAFGDLLFPRGVARPKTSG